VCIIRSVNTHQRTNIVIDEQLIRETLAETGLKTKREAVELGLKTILRLSRQGHMRELRGMIDWVGDLSHMRTDL
jgi:Arc/MetJ family transcription regulator